MASSLRIGTVSFLGALAMAAACTYDFDQFEAGGTTGGRSGGTGADGAGGEPTGGAPAAGVGPGGIAGTGAAGVGGTGTGGGGVATTGGNGGEPATGGDSGSPATGGAETGGGTPAGGTETGGAPAGGTETGGAPAGGTETGGAPAGGTETGGAPTGGSPCGSGQKLCGTDCQANDDPALGCADPSCDPCTLPHAVAGCTSGACSVGSCEPEYWDCDGTPTNGCEIGQGQYTDQHCGGCNNACSDQGYSGGLLCQNAGCVCTSPAQCSSHGGSFDCVSGICSCEGVACQPGETCSRKSGPDWLCGCNGGNPCAVGNTCCDNPGGCRDLQSDNGNCGACGHACPAGTTCTDGACL